MNIEVVETDFETIYKIWSERLWPGRKSKIEPVSAIADDLSIDMNIFSFRPYFTSCKVENSIVAVISGHQTSSSAYRLRGLYVNEAFRGQGLAKTLINYHIDHAKSIGMATVWLLGRVSRESLYSSLGFEIVCRTEKYEFGPHYLMKKTF